jgi:hypothetical protein
VDNHRHRRTIAARAIRRELVLDENDKTAAKSRVAVLSEAAALPTTANTATTVVAAVLIRSSPGSHHALRNHDLLCSRMGSLARRSSK